MEHWWKNFSDKRYMNSLAFIVFSAKVRNVIFAYVSSGRQFKCSVACTLARQGFGLVALYPTL
jgi:hypothetical protein